jgi:hypothetical protein
MNKKMLINRSPVEGPWGGGNNFVKALYTYAKENGFDIVEDFSENIDLIFMIDPRYDSSGCSINEILKYKSLNPKVKIVYRINECDARKGLKNDIDPLINACSNHTDLNIFISNWIKDYHTVEKNWGSKNNHVIYSGTNRQHFRENNKLNNGKINIVTHHWSDNPMKGKDIYDQLDVFCKNNPEYTFTYIGRTKSKFKNTKIISPTFGQDLGDVLSQYDVYVSGTRFDPGPNHIIESIACNIPTYAHYDSGGAVEMVGKKYTFKDFDELEILLKNSKSMNNKNSLNVDDWSGCMKKYFELIKKELF